MRLIDADQFKKYRTELTDDMSPLERMYLIGRNDMVAIIESAPTAEPSIIRSLDAELAVRMREMREVEHE